MSLDPDFYPPPSKFSSPEPPASGLAIASLVLSITGYFVLPMIGAIAGIITGHMALGQIRQSNGSIGGATMAKVGLVLGYLQVVLGIVVMILFAIIFSGLAGARP